MFPLTPPPSLLRVKNYYFTKSTLLYQIHVAISWYPLTLPLFSSTVDVSPKWGESIRSVPQTPTILNEVALHEDILVGVDHLKLFADDVELADRHAVPGRHHPHRQRQRVLPHGRLQAPDLCRQQRDNVIKVFIIPGSTDSKGTTS